MYEIEAAGDPLLLAGRPGEARLQSYLVPGFGALALIAIIAVDVAQSDATTRSIEIYGLLLGVPFALWRGRGLHAFRPARPSGARR